MDKGSPSRGFSAALALIRFFRSLRPAAIANSVMAVTAFLTAWFNLQSTKMEAFMRFDIKQQIERLTLALGVAAVGITLLATVFAAAH